jgi:hypothetical protein
MDASRYRSFFLQPTDPRHRRYEVLRAALIDEQPMQEVAQRFGYRYDTVRLLVSRFRPQLDAGQLPPFSLHPTGAGRRASACRVCPHNPKKLPRRMRAA